MLRNRDDRPAEPADGRSGRFARAAHDAGLRVVAIDDLSTTAAWPRLPDAIERVVGDVGDRALVARVVADRDVGTIVHFAGRIRVDESVRDPALYFEQNLGKTIALLDAATISTRGLLSFVLSSSAAVWRKEPGRCSRTRS